VEENKPVGARFIVELPVEALLPESVPEDATHSVTEPGL
jgi:hypothetical protein